MIQNVDDYVDWTRMEYANDCSRAGGWVKWENFETVERANQLESFPWMTALSKRLTADGLQATDSHEVSINHYLPGRGIEPHIDSDGSTAIVVFSLQDHAILQLTDEQRQHCIRVLLEPRSVYSLTHDARKKFKHSLDHGKTLQFKNHKIQMAHRRLSVALRS